MRAINNTIISLVILCPIFSVANSFDVGFHVPSTKIDDPDFYLAHTKTGQHIRDLQESQSRESLEKFSELPKEFDPIVDVVHSYILNNSTQNDSKNYFYVGPLGSNNGAEFNFSRDKLPTKLVRLAYCFGFDPLIFTGLVRQESHFKRDAVSETGASGFTQLTGVAVAEVSEQLGILGPGYYGSSPKDTKSVPEHFREYINCYLGPNKKWVNMWEDGTLPEGPSAYRNGFVGNGRQWLYITRSIEWLNQDADRNLIYGAVLFKLYLGLYGNYGTALKQYNVSHANTYARNIERNYRQMRPEVEMKLIDSRHKLIGRGLKLFQIGSSKCKIPENGMAALDDFILASTINGLYRMEEIDATLEQMWIDSGFCEPIAVEI